MFSQNFFMYPQTRRCQAPTSKDNSSTAQVYHRPRTNIQKLDDAYHISVYMPGYSRADIQLRIEDLILKVTTKEKKSTHENGSFVHREFSLPLYQRHFKLTDRADCDGISAKMNDGVLVIRVPLKAKEIQKINIQ